MSYLLLALLLLPFLLILLRGRLDRTCHVVPPESAALLVSGVTGRLGHFVVESLAAKGWTVFACVRDATDATALRSVQNCEPLLVDAASDAQVAAVVERVEGN